MKTTYLVYREGDSGRQLAVATPEEWNAILRNNRTLPAERRRWFMKDCIWDGRELDCIYVEVEREEQRRWNSRHTVAQRKRRLETRYPVVSMDAGGDEKDETESLHERLSSDFRLEDLALANVLLCQLREALRDWKPWGEALLEQYLAGESRTCTEALARRYGITDRAMRKRKAAFEKFVLDFLKK